MTTKPPGGRSGTGAASVLQHIAHQQQAEPRDPPTAAERSQHTILVVDDHAALLYSTSRTLQDAGFKTIQTPSGEEAIVLAARADAVVLDVNLPDINGVAVLQAIRAGGNVIPVILTSAVFVDDIHRQVGLDSGASAYLIGPLDPRDLTETLDRALAGRR